ncbi:MAG TPA: hypothetical protein DEA80_10805 [Afipia sp.]|jgi:hypothetical protein|uniref:Uncharacterized protein n=1 Tax=Afipia broomeae ATCC 49717 TaxID=883078 RepID=K8P3B9_9BRAD|nr:MULTISPECIES: hypothetical protein [Afipia]MAH71100.1 hypothetical protein [Afipia sp.]OUX59753.1 MAG: hypothetical protein CBB64_17885 [Afipia sp. TMED4]EKS32923.1 hypothetical protein HMPREF9695_04938 [Afipia broomeae ATCC 49717]HAO40185.1 hypothetical protein [Afipia sp.]HAP11575.1 hypothetical protein [Afipia sp.]
MSDGAPSEKSDRPPLPRDAFRAQRAVAPASQKAVLQPVVVTPAYDDPVTPAPAPGRSPSQAANSISSKRGERPPRNRERNPFEAYGERASSRPYALRLPDPIDLVLRQLAAEQRTQPLRIVDRALYDLFKRLGRLPPADDS